MIHVLAEVAGNTNIVMGKISILAKIRIMKRVFLYISLIVLSFIFLQNTGCKTNNPDPTFPIYSSNDSIVNPPDVFQVVYNTSYMGDRIAYITFGEDAVWLVEKLGDSRIYYWADNGITSLVIEISDTLAMQANYRYKFVANNNNYPEIKNFFTQFNKLDVDYDTYEPKF